MVLSCNGTETLGVNLYALKMCVLNNGTFFKLITENFNLELGVAIMKFLAVTVLIQRYSSKFIGSWFSLQINILNCLTIIY